MNCLTFLFCLTIISQVFTQTCTTKTKSLTLALATEEQQFWGLQDIFFIGENLSYEISNNNYFNLINPIQTDDSKKTYKQPANIIQAVPYTQSINRAWLNSFAFLDNKDGYNVFWAISTSMNSNKSPQFNTLTPILPSTTSQICFGLDFITLTPTPRAIVDCFDPITNKNYFHIVYSDTSFQREANSEHNQADVIGRQIQVKRTSMSGELVYIFRAAPVQSAPSTVDNSVIEVFTLDSSENIKFISVLDSQTLGALNGDFTGQLKFNLVEFELDDDFIYVLDQAGKIYRLKFQPDGIWILDSILDLKSNRPFAMDVNNQINSQNGYTTVIVLHLDTFVLYEWKVGSNEQNQLRIYDTGFYLDPTNIPQFQISQNFIFLQNNQLQTGNDLITIYETTSNMILSSISIPNKLNWLINPYLRKFISLSQTQAQAWVFSQGYLQYTSQAYTSATKRITLTATSLINGQSAQCTSTIIFEIYSRTDKLIYPFEDQTNAIQLPEFISQNTQFTIRQLVSGPSVNFDQGETSPKVNLTEVTVQQLQISSNSSIYPKAENVIFVETLSLDDPKIFYKIFQTKDFHISVFQCEVLEITSTITICSLIGTFNSNIAITKQGFQSWIDSGKLIVSAITNPNQISIYVCSGNNCQSLHNITYEYGQIVSFYFQTRFLWIIRADQIIDILDSQYPFRLQYSVDRIIAKQNGYTDQWNPIKFFGNNILNPNIIFIDNKINLLVVYFSSSIIFLNQISYFSQENIEQVQLGISQKTFFLVEQYYTYVYIQEFNYEDLGQIKFLKQVFTYQYNIKRPNQLSFSLLNGYFYIRAYCYSCQYDKILIYKPNTSQRDIQFKVINLQSLIGQDPILISVTGDSNMFLYLKTLNSQYVYSIHNQNIIQIGPGATTQMVTKSVQKTLRAFNLESSNQITYPLSITIFNTRSNFQLNQSTFFEQTSGKLLAPHGQQSYVPIQQNWFTGNVLNFKIECNDCGTAVKVENLVDPSQLSFSFNAFTDYDQFGDNGFVAQSDQGLWFIKNGKQFAPYLDLELPPDMKCELVKVLQQTNLILSICRTSTAKYVQITSCLAQNECFSAGYLPLSDAKEIKKFIPFTTQQGISLVVLSVTSLSLDSYSEGSIILYNLISQFGTWVIQKTNEIISPKNNPNDKFYPTDITFLEYSTGLYKFFITEAQFGLWAVNSRLLNGFLIIDDTGDLINLISIVNGYGGFISLSTHFQGVGIYRFNTSDVKNIVVKVIVTTSNVAQFAIALYFDNSDPVNKPAVFTQIFVLYEFNRYGDVPALNKIYISGNQFLMIYGSNKNPNITSIIQYEIPIYEQNNLDVQGVPQEVQYNGGQEICTSPNSNFLPLYVESNIILNTKTLYSSQQNNFKLNQNLNFPRLVINSTKDLQSQDLTLIAYNEQVGSSVRVTSQLVAYDIIHISSWKWWYTLLIIISSLLLIITALYTYRKCTKRNQIEQPYLTQVEEKQYPYETKTTIQ